MSAVTLIGALSYNRQILALQYIILKYSDILQLKIVIGYHSSVCESSALLDLPWLTVSALYIGDVWRLLYDSILMPMNVLQAYTCVKCSHTFGHVV